MLSNVGAAEARKFIRSLLLVARWLPCLPFRLFAI